MLNGNTSISAVLAILLLVTGSIPTTAQTSDWITRSQQDDILAEIRKALPRGWVVSQGTMGRTPVDWYTLDERGYQIEGVNGAQTFQTWVLPKDWIGIRRVLPDRPRIVYWEGVLVGRDFKTITNADREGTYEALHDALGNTTSLINSGWSDSQKIFKDRMAEIDKNAQTLLERFCGDQPCRDEAAHSLVVLGVPARSVITDCAEHGTGDAQSSCVSALGYLTGPESIRLLETLLTSPSTAPNARKYAAASLNRTADLSSAPALLEGLRMRPSPDTVYFLVSALERLRYEPAAPDILYQLENTSREDYWLGHYANALATLRYKPAVPVLEALTETKVFTAEWILKARREGSSRGTTGIALMRLTADWGASSDGIRLLLLPPEKLSRSSGNMMVVVIENTGDKPRRLLMGEPPGFLVVDGRRIRQGPIIIDGNPDLGANSVYPAAIDLTPLLADGRSHRIHYEIGSASSNTLILQVPQE